MEIGGLALRKKIKSSSKYQQDFVHFVLNRCLLKKRFSPQSIRPIKVEQIFVASPARQFSFLRGGNPPPRQEMSRSAASWVKKSSCNFPTDSCKFPRKEIKGAQNFTFVSKFSQNGGF